MASFKKIIGNIGKDILKGIEVAVPVLGAVDPPLSPIFTEIAAVIQKLEGSPAASTLTEEQLSAIIQAVATVSAAKQVPTS